VVVIDGVIEIGRFYVMEMNVEKPKIMTISRREYDNKNQLENVEYIKSLGRVITNEARGAREIQSRTAIAKAAFNNKALFTSKLDLNFKEETSILSAKFGALLCVVLKL
jgi:hypothetical protein